MTQPNQSAVRVRKSHLRLTGGEKAGYVFAVTQLKQTTALRERLWASQMDTQQLMPTYHV